MLEGLHHSLDGYSVIRDIVLFAGLWYLLRTTLWLITSIWNGTKAYLLTSLFPSLCRVNLKSYRWEGRIKCPSVPKDVLNLAGK